MRAVPVTAEQVAHIRDYAKEMVGRGHDPLPEHDHPMGCVERKIIDPPDTETKQAHP